MTPPPPPFTYRQWMILFDVCFWLFLVLALLALIRGDLVSNLIMCVLAVVSCCMSAVAQKGRDGER